MASNKDNTSAIKGGTWKKVLKAPLGIGPVRRLSNTIQNSKGSSKYGSRPGSNGTLPTKPVKTARGSGSSSVK